MRGRGLGELGCEERGAAFIDQPMPNWKRVGQGIMTFSLAPEPCSAVAATSA